MAWTQHGHQIVGTIAEDPKDKPPTKRCGGPELCETCKNDVALAQLREKLHGSSRKDPERELDRRGAIAAYNIVYLEFLRVGGQLEQAGEGLHPETIAVNKRAMQVLGTAADYILMTNGLDRKFLDDWHAKNREELKEDDESGKE